MYILADLMHSEQVDASSFVIADVASNDSSVWALHEFIAAKIPVVLLCGRRNAWVAKVLE